MTVKDLVVHLLAGDQEADVVVHDHFGREIKISESDFCFRHYKTGDSPQMVIGSRCLVTPIDIGPEPD